MRHTLSGLLLVFSVALASCGKSTGPLDKISAKASTPAGSRAVLTQDIVAGVKSKAFSISKAMDLAHAKLEAAAGGSAGASLNPASSTAATALSGAVLDAITVLPLSQAGELEIFWMQVGRLAFKSSEEAFANGRLAEAQTLVLGGGKRWQTEPYWLRYTDHDALVSAIMAASGDRSGAIQRLRDRTNLQGVALEVYEKLTGR